MQEISLSPNLGSVKIEFFFNLELTMNISQETLDQVSDDLLVKVENYFDRLNQFALKEIKKIKEEGVRGVCVDYPHVPAEEVKKLYMEHIEALFPSLSSYKAKWKKEASF